MTATMTIKGIISKTNAPPTVNFKLSHPENLGDGEAILYGFLFTRSAEASLFRF